MQLFHGLPGTGRSSLSLAIAGEFRLDVYCISLAGPTITEEDLTELFDQLPEKCLMLLEDVDSAGLVTRGSQTHNMDYTLETGRPDTAVTSTARISLSGLLDVIDCVASQEGRVLIMTTNHVESLDAALLQPGRVDVRVKFDLATRNHAENMFLQAFGGETGTKIEKAGSAELDKLSQMAHGFAAEIPEKVLSPAEIQGSLMNWKRIPLDAIAKVKVWVAEKTASTGRDEVQ
jgi:SpoVK/Ycf46/Vps4 family AAA+-type ATPase